MQSVIAVSSLVLLAIVGVSQAQFGGGAPPPGADQFGQPAPAPAPAMDPMMMMMVRPRQILVHRFKPLFFVAGHDDEPEGRGK